MKKAVKATAKKVVTAKDKAEHKEKARLTRLANPQGSHLASKVQKLEAQELRADGKRSLLASKSYINGIFKSDKIDVANYDNTANLLLIKKAVNYVASKPELVKLACKIVRKTKSGDYVPFYFAQLFQKVAKVSELKDFNTSEALNYIEALKTPKK